MSGGPRFQSELHNNPNPNDRQQNEQMNNIRPNTNLLAIEYGGFNPAANAAGLGPNAPGAGANPQYQRVPQQPGPNDEYMINSNTARYTGYKIPICVKCRYCQSTSITRVSTRISLMQWWICFTMCLLCSWCCCYIPFCISDCKSFVHHCGMCDREILLRTPEFAQSMDNFSENQVIRRDLDRERQRMNNSNQYNTFT
ncbi:unnamed protein product [Moneuplotes crassus]|uniref:LITAF domain-containing protein n=1 Tax=Euplotes crassus TaxID=5936 RepID=A0AAD2D2S1_EUPCR|nr:unnamed protein product [Moneuplotes crassus]